MQLNAIFVLSELRDEFVDVCPACSADSFGSFCFMMFDVSQAWT